MVVVVVIAFFRFKFNFEIGFYVLNESSSLVDATVRK
jgi:hypothetical protein